MNKLKIQTSVAVILNQNHLVLIKRKINPLDLHSGQIAFPGGKVEESEDIFQACVRETMEEIGVELNERMLIKTSPSYFAYYKKNQPVHITAHLFQCDQDMKFEISPYEVERVIKVPLEELNTPVRLGKHKNKPVNVFASSITRQQYISNTLMMDFRYLQFPYQLIENQQIFYGLSWLILRNLLNKPINIEAYNFEFDPVNEVKSQFFNGWYQRRRLNQFIS